MPNDDYEAIEAAVMDTARGRWFLAEFARRNRTADTTLLLTAIERLESMLDQGDDAPAPHEPVTTRALTSSAASELFAVDAHVEPVLLPAPGIPSAGLPDDGAATWVIEEPASTEALRVKPEENEDDDLLQPANAPAQFPPLLAPSFSGPRIERPVAPLQSAMLAAALAQAEETMARAAEPEPPAAPSGYSPSVVDPGELDALSFEEKSVYFA